MASTVFHRSTNAGTETAPEIREFEKDIIERNDALQKAIIEMVKKDVIAQAVAGRSAMVQLPARQMEDGVCASCELVARTQKCSTACFQVSVITMN